MTTDTTTDTTTDMTTTRPGALLVIGSGLKLYREYIVSAVAERARAAGLRLVLINNLRPSWQHDYFDDITVANVFDHDLLADTARDLASRYTVVGLMCWDEPLVLPAAELAAEFGVPGLSIPGVHGCRDKHSCRTRLTAAGLPQPGFALTADLDEARAAAEAIGYPVIVKPRALGASMGVSLAADEHELAVAFRVAHEASLVGDEPFRGGALVEGFADGPEISVDSAVHKGEYLPMFLARKTTGLPPYFEELGHVVDAADPLLADEDLLDTLATAHQVLGIEHGITHTEVRLTARGPVIIEVNGRLGGDLIPYLGRLATGIEPGSVLFDVATGQRPDLTTTRAETAGIRFGYPDHDCVVHAVDVPTRAPGLVLASPMVEPGTTLRLPPGGYIARHSLVVCTAPDPATCVQRLADAAALVTVAATPVDPPPAGTRLTMPAGLLDVDPVGELASEPLAQGIDYHGRRFRALGGGDGTFAEYQQRGDLVWAAFEGGRVRRGTVTGTCDESGVLRLAYTMVLHSGEVIAGHSTNTPERVDGGLVLREVWQRYGEHAATGVSYLEEIAPGDES